MYVVPQKGLPKQFKPNHQRKQREEKKDSFTVKKLRQIFAVHKKNG
jgi:hypothetical protein